MTKSYTERWTNFETTASYREGCEVALSVRKQLFGNALFDGSLANNIAMAAGDEKIKVLLFGLGA